MSAIKEGYYNVEFSAGLPVERGIVIVEGNTVRGGDNHFLYSGTFSGDPTNISAVVTVSALSSEAKSAFGTTGGKFVLELTGDADGDQFSFGGSAPISDAQGIKINANWIAELAL